MQKVNYLLIAVVLVLLFFLLRGCQERETIDSLIQAQGSELVKTRNERNEEISTRLVLAGSYKQVKNELKSKDSLIMELQKTIKKSTISLTLIKNKTESNHTSETKIEGRDTIVRNDTVWIYPTYKTSYADKWESYEIEATKDSIHHLHTMYNKFSISQQYKSQGLFKPKAIEIQIVNSNPHTITVDAQSYLVQEKKRNSLIWLTGALLTGFVASSVLNK